MPFETGLNILWACVAICALGVLCRAEWNDRTRSNRFRTKRLLCVLSAILFLFPCVSESDDLITLQNLQFTLETRGELGDSNPQKAPEQRPGLSLARAFENLQTFQITALFSLLVALLFVALIAIPGAKASGYRLTLVCGRAPPCPLPF